MVKPRPHCFEFISFYSLQMYSIPHTWRWNKHDKIHTLLLRFECLNRIIFESQFIPDDNQQQTNSSSKQKSFEEHLRHQLRSGTWGTKLELMAAATMFQVSVYCCYTSLCRRKYHWEAINPIASTGGNLRTPVIKVKEDSAFYMQNSPTLSTTILRKHTLRLHCFATW